MLEIPLEGKTLHGKCPFWPLTCAQVLDRIFLLVKGHRPPRFPSPSCNLVSEAYQAVIHTTPVLNNKLFIVWSVAVDKVHYTWVHA